jgi:hypothetical protein
MKPQTTTDETEVLTTAQRAALIAQLTPAQKGVLARMLLILNHTGVDEETSPDATQRVIAVLRRIWHMQITDDEKQVIIDWLKNAGVPDEELPK